MNGNVDVERGGAHTTTTDSYTTRNPVYIQPRRYSKLQVTSPQPDYMQWSTASLFICFIWGIFAFIASNKVKKYNQMKAYDQAAHYSHEALRHNRSALACCVVMLLIIGVPLALALIVQGYPGKFPNARLYFG